MNLHTKQRTKAMKKVDRIFSLKNIVSQFDLIKEQIKNNDGKILESECDKDIVRKGLADGEFALKKIDGKRYLVLL